MDKTKTMCTNAINHTLPSNAEIILDQIVQVKNKVKIMKVHLETLLDKLIMQKIIAQVEFTRLRKIMLIGIKMFFLDS